MLDRCPLVLCHGDFFPNQILAENGHVTGVIDWTDVCFAPAELDAVSVRVGVETLPVPLGPFGSRIVAARAKRFYEAYCAASRPLDPQVVKYVEVMRCVRSLVAVAERRRAVGGSGGVAGTQNPNPYDDPRAVSELERRVPRQTGCVLRLN